MTALESADEMEAITAITFLLSLVIKRYKFETCIGSCMNANLQFRVHWKKGAREFWLKLNIVKTAPKLTCWFL